MNGELSLAVTSGRVVTRDKHKLEDLAVRLARERNINFGPLDVSHGVSSPTWLFGEDGKYAISYSDDFDDDFEYIMIRKKPDNSPRISITYSANNYNFIIDVPDALIGDFVKKYCSQPQQQINPLHGALVCRIADQIARIELEATPSPGMVVYSFRGVVNQEQLSDLNMGIIEYFLVDS